MQRVRRATRFVATTVVGGVLVLAGLVMLVTPGPGLVAIAAGLAVLAREFDWARHLLDRIRIRLTTRRHRKADRDPAGPELDTEGPAAPTSLPHDARHVA